MSIYRAKGSRVYVYEFCFGGQRYRKSTGQVDREKARQVETTVKRRLRDQAAGLAAPDVGDTPTFSEWAEITLREKAKKLTRPDLLERTLRVVLGFWGARPRRPVGPAAVPRPERVPRPYHDLRLGDPIANPSWLLAFEQWMDARGLSGSSKNSYRSACSDLFKVALRAEYRALSSVTSNPFRELERDDTHGRVVALPPATILALVDEAGRHIAAALCIAALAPKLRLASILALRWETHFDAERTVITVARHKTRRHTKAAQIVPVSAQLQDILVEIDRAQQVEAGVTGRPRSGAVITWRSEPVRSIKTGLRRAVERIGLTWGVTGAGVTFHTIRHSVATILADPQLVGGLTERLRADVMGHRELRTTQQYTHLLPVVQEAPHAALSAALPGLHAAVAKKRGERAGRVRPTPVLPRQPTTGTAISCSTGTFAGTPPPRGRKTPAKRPAIVRFENRPDARKSRIS